jgi:prefoldin subunit 5
MTADDHKPSDEIDTLRSSEDSVRAKLAELDLQIRRLMIARKEREKKETLLELGKLVYARK